MVRALVRSAILLSGTLMLVGVPLVSQATDAMSVQVRRVGPAPKKVVKARAPEVIMLRGEARVQREEMRRQQAAQVRADSRTYSAAKTRSTRPMPFRTLASADAPVKP